MRCLPAKLAPLAATRPSRRLNTTMGVASASAEALTASNVAAVAPLAPQPLWKFFAELSALPRPSKQEER